MKKFLCVTATALLLLTCAACGNPTATKVRDISPVNKGYFPGNAEASSFTVELGDYVNTHGTSVTYDAKSADDEIATVTVEGSTLTATLQGSAGNTSITVAVNSNGKKAFDLSFTLYASVYERVACIGDSLTYGHTWHNQSYPVYLQGLLGEGVAVQNFGVNGAAVTNRSEASFKLKYDTLSQYTDSLAFAPDIVVIMLGSNDGYNWTGSAPNFETEYEKLVESYMKNGAQQVVLLTSPPTLEGNAFNLPNDTIKAEVCPRQRALAELYYLPLVDLREAFEAQTDLQSLYRPGDGVHFSVAGAELTASIVAETLFKL